MNLNELLYSLAIFLDEALTLTSEAPWTTTEPIFIFVIVGRNIPGQYIGT